MTPLGKTLIGSTCALLALGGAWFLLKKGQLEVQAARNAPVARKVPAKRAESTPARTAASAPTADAPAPVRPTGSQGARPAARESAAAASRVAADGVSQMADLAELVRSGALGTLRWTPPPRNDIAEAARPISEALGLAPAETDALRRILDEGRQGISGAVTASARVASQSPTEYVIVVDESPAARQAAAQMDEAIRQLVGAERYDLYTGLGAKTAIDTILNNSGLTPGTFTVSKMPNSQTGNPNYSLRRQFAPGQAGGTFSSETWAALSSNLGGLSALIPADF